MSLDFLYTSYVQALGERGLLQSLQQTQGMFHIGTKITELVGEGDHLLPAQGPFHEGETQVEARGTLQSSPNEQDAGIQEPGRTGRTEEGLSLDRQQPLCHTCSQGLGKKQLHGQYIKELG